MSSDDGTRWLDWGEDLPEDIFSEYQYYETVLECPSCRVDLRKLRNMKLVVGFSSRLKSFCEASSGDTVPGAIVKRCPFCLQLFWHHIRSVDLEVYEYYILDSKTRMRFPGVKKALREMIEKRDE